MVKNIAITLILVLIGLFSGCKEHLSPTEALDEKVKHQPPASVDSVETFPTVVDRAIDTIEMPTIVKEPTDILSLFQDTSKNIRVTGIYRNMMRVKSSSWDSGPNHSTHDYGDEEIFGSTEFKFDGGRAVSLSSRHILFYRSSGSVPVTYSLDLYVEDGNIDSLYYYYSYSYEFNGNTVRRDKKSEILGIRDVTMLKLSPYKYKVILTGKRVENLITTFESSSENSTTSAGYRTSYGHTSRTTLLPATDDSYLEITIEAL
ncbi:MAG: hypothetical protein KDD67_11200 [Ignavibacteriae bacterium]|nr:hypothetical protein [Ignavibacteriota bacterium]MCB9215854.1 hypothetical protein [Ignavibacteria bacterium]